MFQILCSDEGLLMRTKFRTLAAIKLNYFVFDHFANGKHKALLVLWRVVCGINNKQNRLDAPHCHHYNGAHIKLIGWGWRLFDRL